MALDTPRLEVLPSIPLRHSAHAHLHQHDFHEIFLGLNGAGMQVTDEGEEPIAAGDLFFFPAGRKHIGNGLPRALCTCLVVYVRADRYSPADPTGREVGAILRHLAERHARGASRIPLSPAGSRQARESLEALAAEAVGRSPGFTAAVETRFADFLLAVLRDPGTPAAWREGFRRDPARDRFGLARRFLEENFAQRITVDQMASLCCLSRSRFHEVFRQETGFTFIEHLNQLRVREAARLLREGGLTIQEVADACGFPSLSHFYHEFGRRHDRPPGAFRKTKG